MVLLDQVTILEVYTSLWQALWPLNLVGCWIQGGGLASKRLSRQQNSMIPLIMHDHSLILLECALF